MEAETDVAAENEKLKRQLARLEARLEKAEAFYRASNHRAFDQIYAAVLGGLAVRFNIDGETSERRLAETALRIVKSAWQVRAEYAAGTSPANHLTPRSK